MKVIKRICDAIDLVNDWIGRIASFAVLGILAVIVDRGRAEPTVP